MEQEQVQEVKIDLLKKVDKKYYTTLILASLFGIYGVHRFFNKKFGTGALMLITLGGFGVWFFYDVYLILSNQFNDNADYKVGYQGDFFGIKFHIAYVIYVIVILISVWVLPVSRFILKI